MSCSRSSGSNLRLPRPSHSRAQYDEVLRETDVFAGVFAMTGGNPVIEGFRREGHLVTGNFFNVLGVTAAQGRALVPCYDEPGGSQILVLSHRAWTQHYAGDPGVVGRTVSVNGTAFTIVGVMPEGLRARGHCGARLLVAAVGDRPVPRERARGIDR